MNLQENINRIQEVMGIINEDSSTKEIIFDIINNEVKGADLYEHEGSLWLIFTDDKKWVLEITEDGTLWYNYYFFQSFFDYLSLDVVENQHYITEWVEDAIQNGVRSTTHSHTSPLSYVEDAIQNGVRSTIPNVINCSFGVEDAIQNGVRSTLDLATSDDAFVEDDIQNGVRSTRMLIQKPD